jgi:hypothetical protein
MGDCAELARRRPDRGIIVTRLRGGTETHSRLHRRLRTPCWIVWAIWRPISCRKAAVPGFHCRGAIPMSGPAVNPRAPSSAAAGASGCTRTGDRSTPTGARNTSAPPTAGSVPVPVPVLFGGCRRRSRSLHLRHRPFGRRSATRVAPHGQARGKTPARSPPGHAGRAASDREQAAAPRDGCNGRRRPNPLLPLLVAITVSPLPPPPPCGWHRASGSA